MNNFLDTLKKLGPARLGLMGAVLLGLLIFFVFVSMKVSTPDMKMLYNDLSVEDSSAVAAKLEELKIPFEISNDSTKVMVSGKDVGRARMLLAQEGLPNGGSMGYEIFDKQSAFGTTNFVQNVTQIRALEGELARTISSIDQVKTARVHLVLPQRELFSRESRPAQASVFLQLQGNRALDQDQIAGIQSLIASAVPNLRPKDVSIVDSKGVLLARGGEDDDTLMSNKADQMRKDYERRMADTIEDLVGRTVGIGKVRATVTADLNFDRVTQNEEIYDPASQVIRSSQTAEESSNETSAGADNVSVENNLPGGSDLAGAAGGPSANSNRTEETTNFEISKTTRNLVRETGEVKRLSVAVMLDGTYTVNDKGERTYQARSPEEVTRMTALIKSAIGFNEERGDTIEVANLQFADIMTEPDVDTTKLFGFERSDIIDAVEILTVAIMIVLVVLLVLQPMVGRLLASETTGREEDMTGGTPDQALLPGMPAQAALAGPGMPGDSYSGGYSPQLADEADSMIDVQKVEGRVKASSLKKVEDIISAYPEETVSVLRNWMTTES